VTIHMVRGSCGGLTTSHFLNDGKMVFRIEIFVSESYPVLERFLENGFNPVLCLHSQKNVHL